MEVLAKRVKYLFDNVEPSAGLIIAYYKWRDKPNSIRAGVFDRDLQEPRHIVCNRSAFKRCQNLGDTFQWEPPTEYYLLGGHRSETIIPVEGLIR